MTLSLFKGVSADIRFPPPPSIVEAMAFIEEGRLSVATGRYDAGFSRCLRAAATPEVRGIALVCLGEAEFGRHRYREAITLAKLGLKAKNPPKKEAYLLLGKAAIELRACSLAHRYYQKVRELDPQNPEATAGLASALSCEETRKQRRGDG